jgi:hypothetical protein
MAQNPRIVKDDGFWDVMKRTSYDLDELRNDFRKRLQGGQEPAAKRPRPNSTAKRKPAEA